MKATVPNFASPLLCVRRVEACLAESTAELLVGVEPVRSTAAGAHHCKMGSNQLKQAAVQQAWSHKSHDKFANAPTPTNAKV
jgi:hypothetical protein